jgi:LmbE family N-acetylglucosaminyl deacetylase
VARAATRLLLAKSRRPSVEDLAAPALVFAPHPDDETLGCGGTLALKRQAGAEVRVVFVTDGERSHEHLRSPLELAALRRREATLALDDLGLSTESLEFWGFPDGMLWAAREQATRRAVDILRRYQPAQVFVPHLLDGPRDHRATTEFVLEGLRRVGSRARVYEYPVWLWNTFPWVPWPKGRRLRTELSRSWQVQRAFLGGTPVARRRGEGSCVVHVGHVLARKRHALSRYASQTQRLFGDEHQTLYDVSQGHWMTQLLGSHEIFRCGGMGCIT